MIGRTLSHFEITAKLGEGGMGEVYRARDTKLGRDVAVKVLPAAFVADEERLARFEREARTLATFSHANIAGIFEVGEDAGTHFLVMELVEGETLAERVARGPIPLDDALPIAVQLCEALAAAHDKGIVHRDLKPANVKVTPQGRVKVLDFGLAKALEPEPISDSEHLLTRSPTLTAQGTAAGVLLGTAAYMSPEQARGGAVDRQTDIWAFGCVLYELLAGSRAFDGDTVSDTLAAILKERPSWEELPSVPPALGRLLRRCLEKEPARRLQHIGDARIVLSELLEPRADPWSETEAAGPGRKRISARLAVVAAVLVALATLLFVVWKAGRSGAEGARPGFGEPMHLHLELPEEAPLALETHRPALALSPDGSVLVYVADRGGRHQLYQRPLDADGALPLEGTYAAHTPFFSHEGQRLGFFAHWSLKSISLGGGPVTEHVVASPVTRGASWAPGGEVVFNTALDGGIATSSKFLEGQSRASLLKPSAADGVFSYRWPHVLPGGTHALITIDTGGNFDQARVGVVELRDGGVRTLFDGGSDARYAASGHVVFARAGSLWAAPFDLDRLEILDDPRRVVEDVLTEPSGAAHFSVSRTGRLVYVPGGRWRSQRRLVWVDRQGGAEALPHPPRPYMQPRLSPNGRRLALTIPEGSNYDVWVSTVDRGNLDPITRHPGEDFNPVWAGDDRIVLSSELHDDTVSAPPRLYVAAADGSGEPKALQPVIRAFQAPSSWSPQGDLLAYFAGELWDPDGTFLDLWVVPLDGSAEPLALERTAFTEAQGTFSPDGRWMAYVSDRAGHEEVYLRPFPGPGEREQLSAGGGTEPLWSPDGKSLFYRDGYKMMAVSVSSGPDGLTLGQPRVLFEGRYELSRRPDLTRNYDVSADGRRFLMVEAVRVPIATELKVIVNWFAELERLAPAAR